VSIEGPLSAVVRGVVENVYRGDSERICGIGNFHMRIMHDAQWFVNMDMGWL